MNIIEKIDNYLNEAWDNQFRKAGNGSGDHKFTNMEADRIRKERENGPSAYKLKEIAKNKIEVVETMISSNRAQRRKPNANSEKERLDTRFLELKNEIKQIKAELKENLKKLRMK